MKEIFELAKLFRNAIERARDAGEFVNDITFDEFPKACCGDASDLLGQFLLEKGIKTFYVCGNYYGDNIGNGQSHAWLLYDNETIIDITGDQFRNDDVFLNYDNPVYVGVEDDFHRIFDDEDRDIRPSVYVVELGAFCAPRLSQLYSIIMSYI